MKKLYRAEPIFREDHFSITVKIRILSFAVRRETPGGYWIQEPFKSKETFVLKGNGKRFAHESKIWAIESLKCRRKMQTLILKAQLRKAEAVCGLFENNNSEDVLQNKVVVSKLFN